MNDVVEQYIKDLEKDDVYILGLGRPEVDISDIYLEKKEYKIGSESIIIKTKILAPDVDEMRNSNPRFPNNDITIQIHMIKKAQNRNEEEVAYLCKEINGWGWPDIYDKNNNRINTKRYFCEVGKRFYGTCNVKNEIVPYFNKTNIFLDKDSKGVPVKNFPSIIFNVLIKGLISQTTIDKITDSITSKIRFKINNEYWLDVDPPIEPIATIEEVRREAEKNGWPFNEEEYLKYNSPRSSK